MFQTRAACACARCWGGWGCACDYAGIAWREPGANNSPVFLDAAVLLGWGSKRKECFAANVANSWQCLQSCPAYLPHPPTYLVSPSPIRQQNIPPPSPSGGSVSLGLPGWRGDSHPGADFHHERFCREVRWDWRAPPSAHIDKMSPPIIFLNFVSTSYGPWHFAAANQICWHFCSTFRIGFAGSQDQNLSCRMRFWICWTVARLE